MGLKQVKAELEHLEKEQLIFHISELYKKYKPVKEYFDFFANPDEQEILEKFKARVHEGFYPARGWRLKLYRSRKALQEFKKLGISPEADAELLFYFAEVAVQYAREKKPKTEAYYTRLENSFEKALEFIHENLMLASFQQRCLEICHRSEAFPWNCPVHLRSIYERYFPSNQ